MHAYRDVRYALPGATVLARTPCRLTGHCRLTDSPARTDVALFPHRAVRLIILRVVDLDVAQDTPASPSLASSHGEIRSRLSRDDMQE